jgi:hypothetical protein
MKNKNDNSQNFWKIYYDMSYNLIKLYSWENEEIGYKLIQQNSQ